MNKRAFFAVTYMFAVTAFFSALIIGLSRGTLRLVEAIGLPREDLCLYCWTGECPRPGGKPCGEPAGEESGAQ